MNRNETCCFTGHREVNEIDKINSNLEVVIGRLIQMGYVNFICGGAKGFDLLAANAVLGAKKSHPNIKLHIAYPYPKKTPDSLIEKVDSIEYTSTYYFEGCMRIRNARMVELSSFCVAYYLNPKSGTGQTVRMAERSGLTVHNIY